MEKAFVLETLRGIVDRVTYHNEVNGWSVLKVSPFGDFGEQAVVTVHQSRVFAGATMEFKGSWTVHPRHGRQFRAEQAIELKPASASALEKYLGSGLIPGVGPKTAKRIVRYFGDQTLEVFEKDIERLMEVPGIASKKLTSIRSGWAEHSAIREVMMFLQSHGISTLFSVRIFKQYGENAIALIMDNPYRLAVDFYGIGFFTADKVALSIGFAENSSQRVQAGIRHVLSAAREQGHCYLTEEQIISQVGELLRFDAGAVIPDHLQTLAVEHQLRVRELPDEQGTRSCYYARSLFYDEEYVARRLAAAVACHDIDAARVERWLVRYGTKTGMQLSEEQATAVRGIIGQRCAILTGGPGCGKTTTTRALVALARAMQLRVLLAAPTGRAAQRMSEVVGLEARTIHRLLEYQGSGFKRDDANPLQGDLLIVDESSMLDINLTASLLRAVPLEMSLLFIGDGDQLPSVGAGNVLNDLIASGCLPCYRLTTIFRQAQESQIISFAHDINAGIVPRLSSPFKNPEIWRQADCFFMDSDEATQAQLAFISRVKQEFADITSREALFDDPFVAAAEPESLDGTEAFGFQVPEQFRHVELNQLVTADSAADELLAVAAKVHPWSSLYYGLTALEVVRRCYGEWVHKYLPGAEIQVLSPMIRGSLGTANLNRTLQQSVNPASAARAELTLGERIFRQGDRVIHRRNNYDLEVFNGDIGTIEAVNTSDLRLSVRFTTDNRLVEYSREQITELDLAYAITVHKSQGSEFDVVILPVLTQHFRMLFRNLVYTGLTRAKKLALFVGTRRALAMAVHNQDTTRRQTALQYLLKDAPNR